MLEPSFLIKVAELTYKDPDFERLLVRARCSDAMFRVTTVHGIDLPYFTPITER